MTDKAINTINELVSKGYTPKQIKDTMEDGEALEELHISGEIAEEIHSFLCENLNKILNIGV
jgi:hypothetical protein